MGGDYDEWTKRLSDATTKTHHQAREPWKGGDGKKRLYSGAQAWQLVKTSFWVLGAVSPHHPLFATGPQTGFRRGRGRRFNSLSAVSSFSLKQQLQVEYR